MTNESIELLKALSELNGVSGYEGEVAKFLRVALDGCGEIEHDNLGSLICRKQGTEDMPRIMLPAHMDEIGFVVKDVEDSGCIRFATLGGWLDQVMLGHIVIVQTAKGDLAGVIGCTPPHLMPKEDRDKPIKRQSMFIDVGAKDKKDAEKMGVRVGDPIVPRQEFVPLKNKKYLLGKAWDDRLGCALIVDVLRRLQKVAHPNTVFGVGTVQEEVGTRGAETSAHVVNPQFCMVLDVGIATDTPGIQGERKVSLGKGPILYMLDAGTISHLRFRDFVIRIAERRKIPYQLSLIEGGATDGRAVQLNARGVASVVFGVPTRYIHSHAGIVHTDDYDAMQRLLLEVIAALGPKEAAGVLAAP